MMHVPVITGVYIGVTDGKNLGGFEYDISHVIDRIDYFAIFITGPTHRQCLIGATTREQDFRTGSGQRHMIGTSEEKMAHQLHCFTDKCISLQRCLQFLPVA